MKFIIIPTLLLIAFTTFAQQVENVVATQQGSTVVVSYNLAGTPTTQYYVKLLMSKNGGQSFSQPLKYVTGDVGNAKSGTNNKIIWDAKKELSYFNGNAVFRVEATSLSAPMPEPIEEESGILTILKTTQSGTKITLEFIINPIKDGEIEIRPNRDKTYIIDNTGNKAMLSGGSFGNTKVGYYVPIIKGVPIRGKLVFDGVTPNRSSIPLIAITVTGNEKFSYKSYLYKIKNAPVSK